PGGLGEAEDDRDQDDEGDIEEDRDRDQARGDQQGRAQAPLAEDLGGAVGDDLRPAGLLDDPAEHGAEAHQQGDVAEGAAHALDDGGDDVLDRDAGEDGGEDGDEQQGDEGRPLQLHDREQQDGDGDDGDADEIRGAHDCLSPGGAALRRPGSGMVGV